jgi:hypothetical protein
MERASAAKRFHFPHQRGTSSSAIDIPGGYPTSFLRKTQRRSPSDACNGACYNRDPIPQFLVTAHTLRFSSNFRGA